MDTIADLWFLFLLNFADSANDPKRPGSVLPEAKKLKKGPPNALFDFPFLPKIRPRQMTPKGPEACSRKQKTSKRDLQTPFLIFHFCRKSDLGKRRQKGRKRAPGSKKHRKGTSKRPFCFRDFSRSKTSVLDKCP